MTAGPSQAGSSVAVFTEMQVQRSLPKEALLASLVDLSLHPPEASILWKCVSNSCMLTSESASGAELNLPVAFHFPYFSFVSHPDYLQRFACCPVFLPAYFLTEYILNFSTCGEIVF